MVEKLTELISKYGENDGVVTRIYLKSPIRRSGNWDCLSVAYNNEDANANKLFTFWQTENDEKCNILDFDRLKDDIQTRIYEDVKEQYPNEFSTDYWNEYRALRDRCTNDVISIVRELGGKVNFEENNQPVVGYYDINGDMSNVVIESVFVTDKNVLRVGIDNGRSVTLEHLHELAFISIYESLVVVMKDFYTPVNKYGRKWTKCTDFQQSDDDWIVMVTDEGTLYMDNIKGTMRFVENDGTILITEI